MATSPTEMMRREGICGNVMPSPDNKFRMVKRPFQHYVLTITYLGLTSQSADGYKLYAGQPMPKVM